MSWDYYIVVKTEEGEPVIVGDGGGRNNYTSNVSGMYRKAFSKVKETTFQLDDLDNMKCKDALPLLRRAIEEMENNPADYIPMNPENGWGNYGGAIDYLRRIAKDCIGHDRAWIEIS